MSPLDSPDVFRAVLENLQVGVYIVDPDRRIVFWNRGAEQISGFLSQEVIGRCCRDEILVHCDGNNVQLCQQGCPLHTCLRDGKSSAAEIFLRHKDGHRVPVHIRATPIKDSSGNIVGAAESFEEPRISAATDRRTSGPSASLDHITGLPSADASRTALAHYLAEFNEHHVAFSVLRIHVDRLSQFIANHGPDAGGQLLRIVAQTLRNALRPSDFLGCWGDHEFVVLFTIHRRKALARVCERLRAISSCAGIRWWGDRLSVTLSMGGAIANSGDTQETLLQRAESGLDRSVEEGGNRLTIGGPSAPLPYEGPQCL